MFPDGLAQDQKVQLWQFIQIKQLKLGRDFSN
jgi:hypothetical protein